MKDPEALKVDKKVWGKGPESAQKEKAAKSTRQKVL
jgi:hypothetical protein